MMKMSKKVTMCTPDSEDRLEVIRLARAEEKIQFIRDRSLNIHGPLECVLEVGGKVQGNTIFVLDCFIPRARIDHCSFHVEDVDLSKCWAEAEKNPATSHLNPVADLHFHPGYGRPVASSTDEENSLRQAGLYPR
jgi:hypothetical protein